MAYPVSVLGLATAQPPYLLDQADVARRAQAIFADAFARYPQLADVFANSGIEQRHAVRPADWYEAPRDWRERSAVYLESAGELFLEAARAALHRAGVSADNVDAVVTVSSTGIATPSLEARMARQLGLRSDVVRVPVFGLGCAGGVSGLALASRLAVAMPGKTVLCVVVELCTLAFRRDRCAKADIVATALFGDGAAATVLRAGGGYEGSIRLGISGEHLWPSTLDIMGWSVDPIGFGVVLSRALPGFVEQRFAEPARAFLKTAGLENSGAHYVCHPGGARVLTSLEIALGLEGGSLGHEREVLRSHGNMSAPTVLFVLERAIARGLSGPAVLAALGPGFTASFLAIEAGDA
ncbi:type III polyketide synthase [Stappia sp. F7233]|uniref:Type III polyketide synthase n=1 Tax=Stappia albiluteola TaxID=2758565 RepID=A0A839ADK2_9HYPH|nr:type III polyketide synthase [Stappia albiluteola]MBA5777205.1 type III polyketide synthase [Stappia albiluteola]